MKRLPYYLAAGGATFLFSAFLAAAAPAQTTPPAQTTATATNQHQGAFDKLSPGNQRIVDALFAAEQNNPNNTKPLSRDDIAAMKQDGKGWGEVFKSMKAQGLVQEKNLGQVISQHNHDIREDRRDLKADRQDIKKDREDLKHDRQDLREDRQDLRSDRAEARPDRPERPHR
jgi:hypothetical protein